MEPPRAKNKDMYKSSWDIVITAVRSLTGGMSECFYLKLVIVNFSRVLKGKDWEETGSSFCCLSCYRNPSVMMLYLCYELTSWFNKIWWFTERSDLCCNRSRKLEVTGEKGTSLYYRNHIKLLDMLSVISLTLVTKVYTAFSCQQFSVQK